MKPAQIVYFALCVRVRVTAINRRTAAERSSKLPVKKAKHSTILGSATHLLPQKLDDHVAAQAETAKVDPVPGAGEPAVYLLDLF